MRKVTLSQVLLRAAKEMHADEHLGMCGAVGGSWDYYTRNTTLFPNGSWSRLIDLINSFAPLQYSSRSSYWGELWSDPEIYQPDVVRECRTLALLFMRAMAEDEED